MAAQLNYGFDMDRGLEGMKSHLMADYVRSHAALERIKVGLGVVFADADDVNVRLPGNNVPTVSLDADLVADDDFTISLTVGGTVISETETYAASHADTIAAMVAALILHDEIDSVDVVGRVLTINLADDFHASLVEADVVHGGAGTAIATVVNASRDEFSGIALLDMAREQLATGWVGYLETDAVSVMKRGRVLVRVEDAVGRGDPVFCRLLPSTVDPLYDRGSFRSDADGDRAVGVNGMTYTEDAGAGELVEVECQLT